MSCLASRFHSYSLPRSIKWSEGGDLENDDFHVWVRREKYTKAYRSFTIGTHSVGFKGIHGVTTAQLVLLVYKVVVVFTKVNAAKSRVTTAVRVSTAGWIKRLEEQDMQVNEMY
nr:hypothetical protein [Tanacetum cinerariifolium]GEY46304.1 hypothetical protein [Tanacetum cinerariifolium]